MDNNTLAVVATAVSRMSSKEKRRREQIEQPLRVLVCMLLIGDHTCIRWLMRVDQKRPQWKGMDHYRLHTEGSEMSRIAVTI